jgi:hypothetical protein
MSEPVEAIARARMSRRSCRGRRRSTGKRRAPHLLRVGRTVRQHVQEVCGMTERRIRATGDCPLRDRCQAAANTETRRSVARDPARRRPSRGGATDARSASMPSGASSARPRPGSRRKASARPRASAWRTPSRVCGSGSAPFHISAATSSKVCDATSSSTECPRITNRPACPSTSLISVAAATTSSNPLALAATLMIAILVDGICRVPGSPQMKATVFVSIVRGRRSLRRDARRA